MQARCSTFALVDFGGSSQSRLDSRRHACVIWCRIQYHLEKRWLLADSSLGKCRLQQQGACCSPAEGIKVLIGLLLFVAQKDFYTKNPDITKNPDKRRDQRNQAQRARRAGI